jgi:hypothetical protein
LSFLEIRAERRQKSISVELSFAVVLAFKHQQNNTQVKTKEVLTVTNFCSGLQP